MKYSRNIGPCSQALGEHIIPWQCHGVFPCVQFYIRLTRQKHCIKNSKSKEEKKILFGN